MGVSFLRPLLQSLCCNSPWNYAVFWKLDQQHRTGLVWEDGFCENLKLRGTMVGPIENLYLEKSNKMLARGEYTVGLAVAEMSSGSHVVGKGVVGNAAFTGNASWIYSDGMETNVFDPVLVPEYPNEWLLQFAAGIQTILVLPVTPHGVLQLGSVEMVAEDADLVAYVKDKCEAHIQLEWYDLGYSTQPFSEISTFLENLEETSTYHAFTLKHLSEGDFSQQLLPPSINLAKSYQLSFEGYHPCISKNDISGNYPEEALSPSSYFETFNTRICEELMNESTESTFLGNVFDDTFGEWDNELHKMLRTPVEDNINITFPYTYGAPISGVESVGMPIEKMKVGPRLLDAVVPNSISSINDDNSSNKSGITTTSGGTFASSKKQDELVAPGINVALNRSGKHQKRKGFDSRLPTSNKRRACGNEDNRKPKPRDRQMIQDRLKELRDLVPNSEKCSIDGLLDKTINHMQFLRNVTKQADKLRHHKEEADEKSRRRPSEVNPSHEKGTSWAVELGSEKQACPIVVKDLTHPKRMLIEMQCTDHDRFLEIADAIHRLQLTILEGVMERSSAGDDSSWARFIVEVTGSFHRLDIFWPLMQLVQQSRVSISSKT